MYIPALSKRRGGGGGRGGGGSGGGKGGGSSGGKGSSSGSSSSGKSASNRPPPYTPGAPPPPYSVAGGSQVRGNPSSSGGGRPYTVASGNVFAGRSAGGGTRSGIYGNGAAFGGGALVGAAAFPFLFWPLAFSAPYNHYYGSGPYQPLDNSSRPGGGLATWMLLPASDAPSSNGTALPSNKAFYIYGDANSVSDILPNLASACGTSANVYGQNLTADPTESVQYFRGSTFGLFLDGYNNSLPVTDAGDNEQGNVQGNFTAAALPSTVNSGYLNCLNSTIGSSLGLLDADYATSSACPSLSAAPLLLLIALLAQACL